MPEFINNCSAAHKMELEWMDAIKYTVFTTFRELTKLLLTNLTQGNIFLLLLLGRCFSFYHTSTSSA